MQNGVKRHRIKTQRENRDGTPTFPNSGRAWLRRSFMAKVRVRKNGTVIARVDKQRRRSRSNRRTLRLLQLRILRLGLLQDGDVAIGVLPQREEIVVGGAGFGGVALHGISAT